MNRSGKNRVHIPDGRGVSDEVCMIRNAVIAFAAAVLLNGCSRLEAEQGKRIPVKRIFTGISGGVFYLGKTRTSAGFRKLKRREGALFLKKLHASFPVKFRLHTTRYFNIAYRCPDARIRWLTYFLKQFFRDVYPRYFRHEPGRPFRVVYFRNRREFFRYTGSEAYGFYLSSDRALYTYANSGHGTLWHEMIHAFVDDSCQRDPQQWFNEGFASFYEMAFLRRGLVSEGYSNWRMPRLKAALKAGTVPHLKDFMMEQWMSVPFGYAHARFFFCYLWTKRRMVPFVRGYLYELLPKYSGHRLGQEAVRLAQRLLGKSIDVINKEYLAMVRQTGTDWKLRR